MDSGSIQISDLGGPRAIPKRGFARYWFVALFFALLLLPALTQLSGLDPIDPGAENRTLASQPDMPRTLAALLRFPAAADAYLRDWFGLRQPMVAANDWLRFHLLHEVASPDLLVGKHGRVVFSSHPGGVPLSMIYEVCGANILPGKFEGAMINLEALLTRAGRDAPNLVYVVAPTVAALYDEDLPRWVRAPCRSATPSVEATLAHFSKRPDLLGHIDYPIQFLSELKPSVPVIPKYSFHWFGVGPLRYAEHLSETRFGLPRTLTLPTRAEDWPSDLNRLNPGVDWANHVPAPDFGMAGVSFCSGAACDPAANSRVIAPLDRYKRPQPGGKRLLIIADSFGDNIAGDFIEYFGEVWHVHYNLLSPLTRAELDSLHDLMFRDFHPDQVLFISHDFGIFYVPAMMRDYFWPEATPVGNTLGR